PAWVRSWHFDRFVHVFDRVKRVNLITDRLIEDDDIEALDLRQLRSLCWFNAPRGAVSDEAVAFVRFGLPADDEPGFDSLVEEITTGVEVDGLEPWLTYRIDPPSVSEAE